MAQPPGSLLRAILLYPGPQASPFRTWTEILDRKDPLANFGFKPFVLIRRIEQPLNLSELRLLAKEIRSSAESGGILSFKGPLSQYELFPGQNCPCLYNGGDLPVAILAPPLASVMAESRGQATDINPPSAEPSCRIHQGYLCNAIVGIRQADGIQSFFVETGREVWLPGLRKKNQTGDTECTRQ